MSNSGQQEINILVVDDEPGICILLKEALQRLNCSVKTASNKAAAYRLLNDTAFDIAFIDLTLPDGKGMEIMDDAKSKNPNLFGIIMSGALVDSYQELIEHNIDDYMPKPFSLDQIGYIIARYRWLRDVVADGPSEDLLETGHQLKTPLAVIKEFTHLLNEGKGGDLSEKQQLYVSVIDENVDRALFQLRQLEQMHFSPAIAKSEAGEPLNIGDLISSMEISWQPIMQRQNLSLATETHENLAHSSADRHSTEQILYNLLDNASKYAPEGSTVKLSAYTQDESTVCIEVADNGGGIPHDQRDKVFAPYGRLPDHEAAPGLGLGLTIALKLARQMKGDLMLGDAEGGGASFILRLPLFIPT